MDNESISRLRADHTPAEIQQRLREGAGQSHLRDFIYGAIDGTVTTFAVASGVAGAGLSSGIVIVLGIANLVADGFSMAVSNYLATRADRENLDRIRRLEGEHVDQYPIGEREEVRQIFSAKGFSGDILERIVTVITADRRRWIDTMIREEHGLILHQPSPLRAASITFAAFVLLGSLPLLAFVWQFFMPDSIDSPYLVSSIMTAISFFTIGAIKSRFVSRNWFISGLETLLVGGAAAALAYATGTMLQGLVKN